jgi:hypothetical protein
MRMKAMIRIETLVIAFTGAVIQYFFFSAQTIFLTQVCQTLFSVQGGLHNLRVS